MTVTVDHSVEEFTGTPRKLFINGQWAEAASGKTFETPNPATGKTLAKVAEGYKQSGWGREMGHQILEAYTEVKAVTAQL